MPTITDLTIYPIKSCAGIALSQAMVNEAGLSSGGVHDREWMLVDANWQFLTQREYPRMATIRPEITLTALLIHAPGQSVLSLSLQAQNRSADVQVTIWEENFPAQDCGDDAAAWFSKVLGLACRLVRFSSDAQRLSNSKWTGDIAAPNRFSDGYPILLTATASLEDLNQRLHGEGRSAVPMNRFRPNVVLKGMEAFEEDYAESFSIGDDIQLRPVKPCPRCPMPAVDQVTGEVGPNPVDILQAYRANPVVDGGITFGMNLIVAEGAGKVLRVGDDVDMQIAF